MSTIWSYEKLPVLPLAAGIAGKINALHADAQCMTKQSRKILNNAVTAAW